MKQQALVRAYNDVATNLDDATYTMSTVALTAGFLAGSEMFSGCALIVALAERIYGHTPDLAELKRKLGLMERQGGPTQVT